jgi:hypothetical protein
MLPTPVPTGQLQPGARKAPRIADVTHSGTVTRFPWPKYPYVAATYSRYMYHRAARWQSPMSQPSSCAQATPCVSTRKQLSMAHSEREAHHISVYLMLPLGDVRRQGLEQREGDARHRRRPNHRVVALASRSKVAARCTLARPRCEQSGLALAPLRSALHLQTRAQSQHGLRVLGGDALHSHRPASTLALDIWISKHCTTHGAQVAAAAFVKEHSCKT